MDLEPQEVNKTSLNGLPDAGKPGDILDERYMLTEVVGRGGCGVVFKATDLNLQRDVAIKILSAEGVGSDEMLARFEQESQILRRLHSPNTVYFYDCGQTPDRLPYIVMEFVVGRSLKDIIEQDGIMAPRQVAGIIMQVLQALAEAHEFGFVHRDLKPANIMLCPRPGFPDDLVKVLDFGIAKIMKNDETADIANGDMAGTPKYMPPEQFRNEPLTPLADLYSVGCIAYEMLTGIAPFDGDTFHVTVAKHLFMTPPSFSPEIEKYPNLVGSIFKLLEKETENRFKSATKAIEALEYWNDELLIPALDGCRLKGDDSKGGSFVDAYEDEHASTQSIQMPSAFVEAMANVVAEGPVAIGAGTGDLQQVSTISVQSMPAISMHQLAAIAPAMAQKQDTSFSTTTKIAIGVIIVAILFISTMLVLLLSGSDEEENLIAEKDNQQQERIEVDILVLDHIAQSTAASVLDAVAFGLQESERLAHLDDLLYELEQAEKEIAEKEQAKKAAEKAAAERRQRKQAEKNSMKFEFKLKYSPAHAKVAFRNATGRCANGKCDVRTVSETLPAQIVVSSPGYIGRSMVVKNRISELKIDLIKKN